MTPAHNIFLRLEWPTGRHWSNGNTHVGGGCGVQQITRQGQRENKMTEEKRGKKIVEIGPHSPTDVETRAKRWRRGSNTWPVIGRQSAAWKASWRHRVEMMIIQSVNDAVAPASSIKCTDLAVTIRKDAATPVKQTLAKSCKFSPRHGVDLLRWASCCVSHQVNAELQQLMDVLSDEEKACRRPGAHRQRQAKAGDRLAAEEKAARRYSRPRHATAGTNNKQPPHTCCHLINFTPLIGRVWASFAHQSMATDDTRADTSSAVSIGAIFVLKSPLMDAPALVSWSTHSKWRDVTRHVSACPANGENSCVVALLLFFCPSRTESLLLLLFHLLVILLLLPLRVVFFFLRLAVSSCLKHLATARQKFRPLPPLVLGVHKCTTLSLSSGQFRQHVRKRKAPHIAPNGQNIHKPLNLTNSHKTVTAGRRLHKQTTEIQSNFDWK